MPASSRREPNRTGAVASEKRQNWTMTLYDIGDRLEHLQPYRNRRWRRALRAACRSVLAWASAGTSRTTHSDRYISCRSPPPDPAQGGSGADRIVRAIRLRGALGRCGLCCHDVPPDHRGIRPPWDRNCELAFVNLLRQFDADNDAPRSVERFEPQHRAQSPLHPAVVLLHNVVQVLTATNSRRVPPRKLNSPLIPMRRSALWLGWWPSRVMLCGSR